MREVSFPDIRFLEEYFERLDFPKVQEVLSYQLPKWARNDKRLQEEYNKWKNSRDKKIRQFYSKVQIELRTFGSWDNKKLLKNAAIIAAKAVMDDLKTTQIRKIIEMAKGTHTRVNLPPRDGEASFKKEIEASASRMMMLLAYTAGKNRNVKDFADSLQPILAWLLENPSRENFNRVYEFFEAIISYHRYFGGKE